NMRRGFFGRSFSSAKTGRIASRKGSATATPAPRRNWRRLKECRLATWGARVGIIDEAPVSFVLKQFALHDFVDQRAYPIMVCGRAVKNLFNARAVAETDRRSCGIHRQLLGHIARELLFIRQ